MRHQILALLGLITAVSSCSRSEKTPTLREEYLPLLTGYSLHDPREDFIFEGRLLPRPDLGPESAYVYYKAYKIHIAQPTALFVAGFGVLSECNLEKSRFQASIRTPESYHLIHINPKIEDGKPLFPETVPQGYYVLTFALINPEPCQSGFEVGLSLTDSRPTLPEPIRPASPRADSQQPSQELPKQEEKISPELPIASPSRPIGEETPQVIETNLQGEWELTYTTTQNRTIKQIYRFTKDNHERLTYERDILMEHILFHINYKLENKHYDLTVTEVKTYRYSPARYQLGAKSLCSYLIQTHQNTEYLWLMCAQDYYPQIDSRQYLPYKKKV